MRHILNAPAFKDRQLLHVFPLNGTEDKITLPIEPTQFAYSQDGKSLYGFNDSRTGLFKIELKGMRVSEVNPSVRGGFGLAVSPDETRVIVSRTFATNGSPVCGLFEFRAQTQVPKMLVENPGCGANKQPMAAALSMWKGLGLSPDGERMVAHNRDGLVVIDLTRRTTKSLLGRFSVGAWSPNGKWLAVVEEAGERGTILLDAKSLKDEKVLGTSGAAWSPDSRYLLGVEEDSTCGPYWATFQVIDVESERRKTVEGSKCRVNLGGIGWIRRD